jgi:calcineurin-like phosphoesterase family protein
MGEIFITSDTHFCHIPNFLWEPRGFNSVEEMNEEIVERWNAIVKPEDSVWHLGDMALSNVLEAIEYINQLNGTILWIGGNHDTNKKIKTIIFDCGNVHWMGWAYNLKVGNINCYLSHYPTLTSNFDEKHFSQHVINFHGHTHQKTNWINPSNPFTYHVGMDSHNCTPIHIEEAIADVRQRWNEIEKLPTSAKPEDIYPYGGII